jgi:5-methylcytosine-specific restriction endonuclease McrA
MPKSTFLPYQGDFDHRYKQYTDVVNQARKLLSPKQKEILIRSQNLKCVGVFCKGEKDLDTFYECDHIVPLFKGGDSSFNILEDGTLQTNYRALCARCHRHVTRNNRIEFYAMEREAKYGKVQFVRAADFDEVPAVSD